MNKILFWLTFLLIIVACNGNFSSEKDSQNSQVSDSSNDKSIRILEKKNVEYAYPHWSKDGDKILFQSNETGRWQIYIMNENGSDILQLTTDSSNNNFIDWSPNNQKICFVSDRTGNEEIFIMDSSGNNQKQLTYNDARDIHPYWSPDGSKIYFNSTRDDIGDFEIYEMNLNGSNLIRITYNEDNETCARLSPSGDKLIYLKNNNKGLDDVFIMNLTDSIEKNITNTITRDGWPSWFPNGKEFIFSAKENGVYKLFVWNILNNTTRRISNPTIPYWDGRANISADGKKIVFNRQIDGKKNTIGIYILHFQ